jgi:hypothetical protein
MLKAFRRFVAGADLNGWRLSPTILRGGLGHEHRQDAFRAAHGFSALEQLRPGCRALRRQPRGSQAVLRRAISDHGVRPTDLPREFARHRGLPVGTSLEALPHGPSRTGPPLHPRGCQRVARLAHLCRVRPTADRAGQTSLRQRKPGSGADQQRLRAGFHHHRFVPVGVPVGPFPGHQIRGEDGIRCSICAATFRALSISRTASCTMFMRSIC